MNVHQLAAFFWGSLLPEGAVIKTEGYARHAMAHRRGRPGNTFYAASGKILPAMSRIQNRNTDIRFSKFRRA